MIQNDSNEYNLDAESIIKSMGRGSLKAEMESFSKIAYDTESILIEKISENRVTFKGETPDVEDDNDQYEGTFKNDSYSNRDIDKAIKSESEDENENENEEPHLLSPRRWISPPTTIDQPGLLSHLVSPLKNRFSDTSGMIDLFKNSSHTGLGKNNTEPRFSSKLRINLQLFKHKDDYGEYLHELHYIQPVRGVKKIKSKVISLSPFDPDIEKSMDIGIWSPLSPLCKFFVNTIAYTKEISKKFNNIFGNVDIKTFFLFLCLKNTEKFQKISHINDVNLIEIKIKEILNEFTVDSIINEIKPYILFLIKKFSLLNQLINNLAEEYNNFIELKDTLFKDMKDFDFYGDVLNIVNNLLSFLFIKWTPQTKKKQDENGGNTDRGETLVIEEVHKDYLYLIMIKIENYIKSYFPVCCGKNIFKNEENLSTIYFCLKCKITVCEKCLKNHKTHKKCNMDSRKYKKINATNEHFARIETDMIIEAILNKIKTESLHSFVEKSNKHEEDRQSFFSIFDFIEIFLYEHFYKQLMLIKKKKNFSDLKKQFAEDPKILSLFQNLKIFNFNIKDVNMYEVIVKEYEKKKGKEEQDKKPNRYHAEEYFNLILSTELNVNKSIVSTIGDLNIDFITNDFDLMISQPNSPKHIYMNNLMSKNQEIKQDQINKPKSKKYKFLLKNLGKNISKEINLSEKYFAYKYSREVGKGRLSIKDETKERMKNFFARKEKKKTMTESIVESWGQTKELGAEEEADIIFSNLLQENEPKYNLICLFIQDLINKVKNYGRNTIIKKPSV